MAKPQGWFKTEKLPNFSQAVRACKAKSTVSLGIFPHICNAAGALIYRIRRSFRFFKQPLSGFKSRCPQRKLRPSSFLCRLFYIPAAAQQHVQLTHLVLGGKIDRHFYPVSCTVPRDH